MSQHISSILIPTYNRSKELGSLIHYSTQNFDLNSIHFMVLDGSDDEKKISLNKSVCENKNVGYHHFGSDVPYLQRILNGLKMVETETVSLLGDDDIIEPKGFSDCVNFLNNNKDYSIAHGKYVGFNYASTGINFNPTYISKSIEDNSLVRRLFNFLSAYTAPTYYAVNRTSLLKKSFEELIINRFDIHDYVAAEILVGAIPIVNGKLKRLESFYQARKFIPDTKGRFVIYPKYVMASDFSEKINKIRKSIIKNLPDAGTAKEKQIISDAIDYSLAAFFQQRLNPQEIYQRFEQLL